jgi:hypothetical protein
MGLGQSFKKILDQIPGVGIAALLVKVIESVAVPMAISFAFRISILLSF